MTTTRFYIEALAALARATAFTGAIDEAEPIGDRAVDLARAMVTRDVLAATLRASVTLTLRPRGVGTGSNVASELVGSSRSTGNEWLGAAALHRAAYAYMVGDRPAWTNRNAISWR